MHSVDIEVNKLAQKLISRAFYQTGNPRPNPEFLEVVQQFHMVYAVKGFGVGKKYAKHKFSSLQPIDNKLHKSGL
ncbi:hypothetical protein J6590_008400 [Homalodisca vitripennis]|nr:hypothetical protein J6590_008400 [Homalodisca vitripennis]